jgi:ABC-type lipoprotein release transport system permease subunit
LTLALLFTIALGIGSNLTVLGFIRGLTMGKPPLPVSDRVVSLIESDARGGSGPVSYEAYLSLRSHVAVFEWVGAARVSQEAITLAGRPAILSVAAVTPNLARLLHLPLEGGVAISHRLWQSEFGGKVHVRGERVRIGDAGVIGVAPDWLEGVYSDRAIDLWTPLREESRSVTNVWIIAGLRPGVSAQQAEEAVRAARVGSGEMHVVPYAGVAPEMAEGLSRVGTLLRLAAGFVFFIACANVASFLLGRAAGRLHETSLRVALGAGRGRLARAVLSDSVVISVAGGALGVLLALWTSKVVPALLFEQDAGFLVLAPDVFMTVAAAAAGVGIVIACGLLPLIETPQARPAAVLHRERAGPSKATRTVCAGLVIGQMACCCLLVVSSGFFYHGLCAARQTGVSMRLGQAVLAFVHSNPDVGIQYFREVEHAARSVAGVTGTAWVARLPGSQPAWQSFHVEPRGLPLREVKMDLAGFTSDSLELVTLPPKAGRLFAFEDRGCRVAVLDTQAAEVLFGDDTVGRSVYDPAGEPVEIIGVVAVRGRSRPTIYYDYTDRSRPPSARTNAARFHAPVVARLDVAELDANVVSSSYFAAMGISLVAGRIFAEGPTAHGCRVGVVNQEAANLYFAGNAVGAAVIDDIGRRTEIIGVVQSAKPGAFQRREEPSIYFPMVRDFLPAMTLILSGGIGSGPRPAEVRRALQLVPGRGPVPPVVKTLDAHLSQTALAPLRIATVTFGASATAALLLCILGLYGTLNTAARQRRRELAVRIALGARRRDVIGQVLREGGKLAGAGALVGVLALLLLSRLLPRIAPSGGLSDLWEWIAGPAVLAGAVALASVLPARRALMVDPLNTLRNSM